MLLNWYNDVTMEFLLYWSYLCVHTYTVKLFYYIVTQGSHPKKYKKGQENYKNQVKIKTFLCSYIIKALNYYYCLPRFVFVRVLINLILNF